MVGLDLKRYLPGGDLDPRMIEQRRNPDHIYGPADDIFQRVHIRYRALCVQGELWRCNDPYVAPTPQETQQVLKAWGMAR